jgi:hypothetical protein
MKGLSHSAADPPAMRSLSIKGRTFELTVREQAGGDWHWLITAPGQIVLSGGAPSEAQAVDSACQAGEALARLASPRSLSE